MVFMNFWFIENYGACFGNDFDAVMNYFKHIQLVIQCILNINID